MKQNLAIIIFATVLAVSLQSYGQEEVEVNKSNIQTYTPSKLLDKGQWDIKFFNSIYTQTKSANGSGVRSLDKNGRSNFFTTTLDVFTGISDNNRLIRCARIPTPIN